MDVEPLTYLLVHSICHPLILDQAREEVPLISFKLSLLIRKDVSPGDGSLSAEQLRNTAFPFTPYSVIPEHITGLNIA